MVAVKEGPAPLLALDLFIFRLYGKRAGHTGRAFKLLQYMAQPRCFQAAFCFKRVRLAFHEGRDCLAVGGIVSGRAYCADSGGFKKTQLLR